MTLPKWLWRLLHSKRFHMILVVSPFAGIIGLVLFYAIVNRIGRTELDATRADLQRRGYPVTFEDLISQNPAPEDDLMAHPALASTDIDSFRLSSWDLLDGAGVKEAALVDFTTIDPATGAVRILPADPSPAKMLGILMASEGKAAPFREALRRKSLSLRIDPPIEGFTFLSGMPFSLLNSFDYFRDRDYLHLETGDSESARENREVLHHLVRLSNDRGGSLVCFAIAFGQKGQFAIHCWEIAQHPELPTEDLEEMERWLSLHDVYEPTLRAIHAEIVMMSSCQDQFLSPFVALPADRMDWSVSDIDDFTGAIDRLRAWIWQVQPRGFLDLQLDTALREIDSMVLKDVDGTPRSRFHRSDFERFKARADAVTPISTTVEYWDMSIADSFWAGTCGVLTRSYKVLAEIRLARLAVACERYRRDHDVLPSSMDDLVPAYLPKKLVSPFDDSPLTISRASDNRLALEAAGLDPDHPESWTYPAR